MGGPQSLAFGPSGDLFVTDGPSQSILRFDGITGASLGTFASVGGPRSLAFGPNGDLFASSGVTNSILRFDGTTGLPLGIFAHTVDDCLGCTFSMSFGPGGDLYVAEGTPVTGTNRLYGSNVRRFDGTTGAPLGTFLSSPGLHDFAFGPDGTFLYRVDTPRVSYDSTKKPLLHLELSHQCRAHGV
jgi:WD40 repeat protein